MRALLCTLVLAVALLSGCARDDADTTPTTTPTRPSLPDAPATTSYHLLGGMAADPGELLGNNTPFRALGSYAAIGHPTFEPTIGSTSSGALFMTSLRNEGPGGILQTTHVIRGTANGTVWEDVGPFLGPSDVRQVPNSNDPFLYVDPWTDRIYNFDMCATLSGFCVEFSDDDGATWSVYGVATGEGPALDHQSLAAAPAGEGVATVNYPNVLAFCVNRGPNIAGAWCSTSRDGGVNWSPLLPGYPAEEQQCIGVHGHVKGAADGNFYRGSLSCDGAAVYRSVDGGVAWTQHELPNATALGHDVEVAVDEAGNVYAFWIAEDGLPYISSSTDQGTTWREPMVASPNQVTATGFATIAAGAPGRVAFGYIGTTVADGYDGSMDDATWNGYLGVMTDALSAEPLITTVTVNDPVNDPLDTGDCGNTRCGGFGDFIGITIDPFGRPWVAMANNERGGEGIVGTTVEGPALRGPLAALPPIQVTGFEAATPPA